MGDINNIWWKRKTNGETVEREMKWWKTEGLTKKLTIWGTSKPADQICHQTQQNSSK